MWKSRDNIGSVEILTKMGNDLMVVNAARVSFHKESKELNLNDEKLIYYLAKHNHTSPFFHPQIQFRIKMPIFVAREWYRHTVGFSRNEVSRRYVSDLPDCWIPFPEDLRERDPKIKQGSKDNAVSNSEQLRNLIDDITAKSIQTYSILLERGVAPEIARSVLPQSMYTEFIETGSLAAYARLYNLRSDPTAQKEIREYASVIGSILQNEFPISWKALTSFSSE